MEINPEVGKSPRFHPFITGSHTVTTKKQSYSYPCVYVVSDAQQGGLTLSHGGILCIISIS